MKCPECNGEMELDHREPFRWRCTECKAEYSVRIADDAGNLFKYKRITRGIGSD